MAPKGASVWTRCPDCEDWGCNRHFVHVFECECPDYETFLEMGIDPYLPGSLKQYLTHEKKKKGKKK